jgi:hypothetical protein
VEELDSNELTTVPPSVPPKDLRAELPAIPAAAALGAWNSLAPIDLGSLGPPATEVEPLPPPSSLPSHPLARMNPRWVAAFAATTMFVVATWSTVRALRARPHSAATRVAARNALQFAPPPANEALAEASPPAPLAAAENHAATKSETAKPAAAKRTTKKPAKATRPKVAAKERPRVQPQSPVAPVGAPAPAPPSFAHVDTTAEFDRSAALQVLRDAGDRAGTCLVGAHAPGPVRIAVTFLQNGNVGSARVEGNLAGSSTAVCIEHKFRSVRIPAFRGSSLTVRKTITF